MDATVLSRPEVKAEFARFVLARLWIDRDPAAKKLQSGRFNTTSLPFYVIVDPATGRELSRIEGLVSKEAFLEFLQRVP